MVLFLFSPQRVLQALLIKHISYSAAMICQFVRFPFLSKVSICTLLKSLHGHGCHLYKKKVGVFLVVRVLGKRGQYLNPEAKWKVRLAGALQGENRRDSKRKRCVQEVQSVEIAKINCEISCDF